MEINVKMNVNMDVISQKIIVIKIMESVTYVKINFMVINVKKNVITVHLNVKKNQVIVLNVQ